MKEEYFPRAIQILDWYHAVEHLWAAAHELFGETNTAKCKAWVDPFKELLWEGKVDQVIKSLIKLGQNTKINQNPIWGLHGYLTVTK